MLEQLASINWSTLSHAYGPAEDVPQLLRDLTSPDEQKRGHALGTLYTNIYHQGTVYQASAYAAPFLIELAQQEAVLERDEILVLLAHLAQGNTYHRQHWHFYSEERRRDPTIQAELEEGIFWVEKTYEAVAAGLPLYASLLAHPDAKIRMAAPRVLGMLFHEAPQVVPVLCERFDGESDQRVQASLLYAVGALLARQEERHERGWQLLVRALESSPSEFVRLAAAMALGRTRRPEIPTRAFDALLETFTHYTVLAEIYEELPWANMRLVFDLIRSFYEVPQPAQEYVLPRVMNVLNSLDQMEEQGELKLNGLVAGELAELLITLAFGAPDEGPAKARMRKDLTNLQYALLSAILHSDVVWRWDVGKGHSMTSRPLGVQEDGEERHETIVEVRLYELLKYGLPDTRQALRAFLGEEPREQDVIRIVSRQENIHWTPEEQKEEVLAELIALNQHCQLADLKMLIGDYS